MYICYIHNLNMIRYMLYFLIFLIEYSNISMCKEVIYLE